VGGGEESMGGTPLSSHGQPEAVAAVLASPAEKKKQLVVLVTPAKREPPAVTDVSAQAVHDAGTRALAWRSAQAVPEWMAREPR